MTRRDVMDVEHFRVDDHRDTDHARLHLQGEFDMAAVPVFVEHFERAADATACSLMLIDVTDLHYCDSSGIRALLAAAARCDEHGVRFRIVGAHGTVRRVFELTDTIEVLNVDNGRAT